jgi:hypothetical protein
MEARDADHLQSMSDNDRADYNIESDIVRDSLDKSNSDPNRPAHFPDASANGIRQNLRQARDTDNELAVNVAIGASLLFGGGELVVAGIGVRAGFVAGRAAMSAWGKGIVTQGLRTEIAVGRNLHPGFPVIDHAVKNAATGAAQSITSIKSVDLGLKSYQSAGSVYNRLMNYAQKLANFKGERYAGERVRVDSTTVRNLTVGVPGQGTFAQQQGIQWAIEDAASIGVNLSTVVVP